MWVVDLIGVCKLYKGVLGIPVNHPTITIKQKVWSLYWFPSLKTQHFAQSLQN
jgi:hypothetical protein